MRFRFLIFAARDQRVYAGFGDLRNAERYAEQASEGWPGKVLVLDSQTRMVILAAQAGKLDFKPRDQYPL